MKKNKQTNRIRRDKKIYKKATQYSPLILYLQDNQEQTDTTPLTQLEKSMKNDQQTKGKKKRKKKNKAQSKATTHSTVIIWYFPPTLQYEVEMQSFFIAKLFILNEINFRAHSRYECLGSPWCSQRSSERTQWTKFYYTNPYTDSFPSTCNIPPQGHHWCSRNSELNQSSWIGGSLFYYIHCLFTWFHNFFK